MPIVGAAGAAAMAAIAAGAPGTDVDPTPVAAPPAPIAGSETPAGDPATAAPPATTCQAGRCAVRLRPDQMLGYAQTLIEQGKFSEARNVVTALSRAPGMLLETRFLSGFIAQKTGDRATAIHEYRSILADDPGQTRVRLELARLYLEQGKTASADHHFKLAQGDQQLPAEIAQLVRSARNIIRSQRAWTFNVDVGVAPDSNINNATSADKVTLQFGDVPFDFTLDQNARARSGTGQTATVQAGLRLPVAKSTMLLLDADASGNNYRGTDYDDYTAQLAAGPEFRLSQVTSLSVQGVGAQRWYGGALATRQAGGRVSFQTMLSSVSRLGVQIDARHSDARFNDLYSGWQVGLYGSYERVLARTVVGSTNAFVRRDKLRASPYSSIEFGGGAGLAAELPYGFNASGSFSVSRAIYDAPIPLFSVAPRQDWRLSGRVTLGNRKLAVLGFSPTVSWSVNRTASGIDYFSNERSRLRFGVSRYF